MVFVIASHRRLDWEDLSAKDQDFRIKNVAGVLNEHLLRTAKADAKALCQTSATASVLQKPVPFAVLSKALVSPRVLPNAHLTNTKCSYSQNFGHTADACRKKAKAEAAAAAAASAASRGEGYVIYRSGALVETNVKDAAAAAANGKKRAAGGLPGAPPADKLMKVVLPCRGLPCLFAFSLCQMKCFKCKGFGHLAKDCPDKSAAAGA